MAPALGFIDGLGGWEVMALAVLALLLFGSKRMPELARSFGRTVREFKRATRGVEDNLREAFRDEPLPTIRPPARQIPARTSAAVTTTPLLATEESTPPSSSSSSSVAPNSAAPSAPESKPEPRSDEPEEYAS